MVMEEASTAGMTTILSQSLNWTEIHWIKAGMTTNLSNKQADDQWTEQAPPSSFSNLYLLLFLKSSVILRLQRRLRRKLNLGKAVVNLKYMQEHFSSSPIVLRLHWWHSASAVTPGGNRLAGCQLENEKILDKRGKGSVDTSVGNQDNMDFVKWYDNKSVRLLSSNCAVEPENKAKHWS